MLKTCQYCGHIHDKKNDCGKKPGAIKKSTPQSRFRDSSAWQHMRAKTKERDYNLCRICLAEKYDTLRKYNYDCLSVHHIIPIEEDYNQRDNIDNTITLCNYHHELADAGKIPRDELLTLASTPPPVGKFKKISPVPLTAHLYR